MNNGLIVQEQVLSGPRFPVGMPVRIDRYFGVEPTDGGAGPPTCRVVSIRLAAEVKDEWVVTGPGEEDGYFRDSVTYPMGWEYLVVRNRRLSEEWGWVREQTFIDNGYGDPDDGEADEPTHDEGDPVALMALEDLPLSAVDPEAVFPCAGDLPRIGTDATKHDVRGACR